MNLTRREALKLAIYGAASTTLWPTAAWADTPTPDLLAQNAWALQGASNFHAIYDDPASRQAFYPFLQNVFHLYPEQDMHRLIATTTAKGGSDRDIYEAVQKQLPHITPELAGLRYALPALRHQKKEMRGQTLQLLGSRREFNGYLEVGTTGRYLSVLRRSLKLSGDCYLLHNQRPGYDLTDVAERGQIRRLGHYIDLNDYAPIDPAVVADNSLDLVANFIGFHHSPSDRLDGFVRSLHRVLRPGGLMVVRDHDAAGLQLNHTVALAHDVFNMGLHTDWSINQQEIRHFTTLAELRDYLQARGFQVQPGELYQPGDPTHNALMLFTKA